MTTSYNTKQALPLKENTTRLPLLSIHQKVLEAFAKEKDLEYDFTQKRLWTI